MKLLIILLLPLSCFAQTFTDSVVVLSIIPATDSTPQINKWIRFSQTYQSTAGVPSDSILTINSSRKRAMISPMQLPISTAQAAVNAGKQPIGNYASGVTNTGDNAINTLYSGLEASKLSVTGNGYQLTGLTKTQVGLSAADNTSDAGKPVSTAQAAAIALKSSIYVGIDVGASDSYVITTSPVPTSYTVGMVVILKANTVNTGAATVNVNALGVKNIVKRVSTVLANGDIPALSFKILTYDGVSFVLLNPVVN